MFSTPLICSSSGVATVLATVSGLAPGNWAVTCTDGGTTSGYSEIGSCGIAIRPARKMTAEMTPAKIGRSMKNRDRCIMVPGLPGGLGCFGSAVAGGAAALDLRHDRSAGGEPLQMIEDHAIAGLQSGEHDPITVDLRPEFDAAIFGLVATTDDKDEALALVVADSAFRHQQRIVDLAIAHAHRNEHTGNEAAVGIVEASTGADRAGARIDPVVEALDMTAIGAIVAAARDDLDRDLLLLVVRRAVVAHIVHIGLFVDFNIGIDAVVRHDRSEQLRRLHANQIAERDFGAADAPGDRRLHIGVVEVDLRRFQGGLGGSHRGLRHLVGIDTLIIGLLRQRVGLDQLLPRSRSALAYLALWIAVCRSACALSTAA